MANPSGYRTFTAGEVLTAANVQAFLQDQVIGVYANAAAAGSALGTPAEGQFRYLEDTDAFEYYDGAAWQTAGGAGGGGFENNFLLMGG